MTLVEAARKARDHAHAPYSGFAVGAAVRTASGRVFAGCNVENAAYPESLCAEAGAIAAMVAAGESCIVEVAVVADAPCPVPPCGGCRQKLSEFAGALTPVTMANLAGGEKTSLLGDLLPGRFDAGFLPGA